MTAVEAESHLSPEELLEAWPVLSRDERTEGFSLLPRHAAEDVFYGLSGRDAMQLIMSLPFSERRSWIRLLEPDDVADVIQEAPVDERDGLFSLLDDLTRKEVAALMAYAEDDAGGLMSPRYARVRPDMTVDEALAYLRKQARGRIETIYYAYVLDAQQKLLGVVTFRELFAAEGKDKVRDIMKTEVLTIAEDLDQEGVSRRFAQHGFIAMPVVDAEGRMKGIVTHDDIVEVVEEEATEDIQKMGGTEALDAPYMTVGFWEMIKKRGSWLSILCVGEMLTATAMAYFEGELKRAAVLMLFVPLIISSGGNSGSQASTLVIRALALGEVRLRDWWRVVRRELAAGLALGAVLGTLGFVRIVVWQSIGHVYGDHWLLIAGTIFIALVGVVLFGTLAGSMLPFVLRTLKLDPASASAPFVATLVDVSGLVIYFTVASLVLSGTLL